MRYHHVSRGVVLSGVETVKSTRASALACLAFVVVTSISPAHAQNWPTKPVTVIVPFAAGGNTDVAARIFTDRLSQRLGQSFVVENKTGAGGSIGIGAMAKANPDGYTMGIVTAGTLFILPHIYKQKLGYDGRKDIRPGRYGRRATELVDRASERAGENGS